MLLATLGLFFLLGRPGGGSDRAAIPGRGSPPAFARVVEQVLPAVVSIDVERSFRHADVVPQGEDFGGLDPDFGQEEFEIPSTGSGFVIDPNGYVLTNDHVVRDGSRIEVHFSDGCMLPARLIGRDPMTDVAVLQVEPDHPLPSVRFGDSDGVRIGDWVVAIGNPLGMLEGSVTSGIVSGKGRSDIAIRGGSPSYQDFLQTDASINPGNSGGPLVNGRGEVIGVNTAFNSPGNGIGFAISINMARRVAEQLIRSGRVPRGFLGVNLMPMDRDLARGWGLDGVRGVLITDVQTGTPASEGGLREGDIVVEFGGVVIESIEPFRLLVAGTEIGRPVTIRYLRKGDPRRTEVRLVERSDPIPSMPEPHRQEPVADLGLFLSPLTAPVRGVLVDSFVVESPASRAGLLPGDVILEIGWTEVGTPEQLLDEVERQMGQRGVVALQVRRAGYRIFLALRGD